MRWWRAYRLATTLTMPRSTPLTSSKQSTEATPSAEPTRRAFSVSVFARHEGRILLVRHKRLGTFLPVGGEVEPGETPLEAAARELREETGLEGNFSDIPTLTGTPPGFIGYEEHMAGSKGLHLNFDFVADVDSTIATSNGEWDEHVWTTDATEVDCPPNVRELVNLALAGDYATSLEGIASSWLLAFNAKNLDALLELYADDAVHTSPKLRDRQPETKGEIRGKQAMRAWWQDAFERLPELLYEPLALTASNDRVFMEYLRHHPGEPSLRVAEVLIIQNRLITESRVYHG